MGNNENIKESERTNNVIKVSGEVIESPVHSHEVFGENFYIFTLKTLRSSGNDDLLPVSISERLVDIETIVPGAIVEITGQIRTFNRKNEQNQKTHLVINVFAQEIEFLDDTENDTNNVYLTGYLCKQPTYRQTPLGREICDLLLAVNRPYGKSDYVPAVAWGRNAGWANTLEVGTKLKVKGRLQSRTYQKKTGENPDGTPITTERTAYELSISKLEIE